MSSEFLLSTIKSGKSVALTAPLVLDDRVRIGFALSSEESYCANLSLYEFTALCAPLCLHVETPRIFHGLKRIWEFLGERGLLLEGHEHKDININKIEDTKLMAYLLGPDSGREVELGESPL